jgi:hypothetical protein
MQTYDYVMIPYSIEYSSDLFYNNVTSLVCHVRLQNVTSQNGQSIIFCPETLSRPMSRPSQFFLDLMMNAVILSYVQFHILVFSL